MSNLEKFNYTELPLMPLRELVLFPKTVMPLFVGRENSINSINISELKYDGYIFLVTQKDSNTNEPRAKDLYSVGVVARILQVLRLPDKTIKILVEGLYRASWKINSPDKDWFLNVNVNTLKENPGKPKEAEAVRRITLATLEKYNKNNNYVTSEVLQSINSVTIPGNVADLIIPHIKLSLSKKQQLLEECNGIVRLENICSILEEELSISELEQKIKSRVQKQIEKNQREYYLSEKVKAIYKEMGKEDDPSLELKDLEERIDSKVMPEETKDKVKKELKKLNYMSVSSAEYAVVHNYVNWIVDLPWDVYKDSSINIKDAKAILDKDHYGLEKVKERILEFLAVQKLSKALKGPILCLVGPPGVGKTSLARSIANATNRDYIRLSLGGVRDEAEIRGHRRTYIGAMPGKIIQSLKRVKFSNPLFCLDEIDKMTSDFRGDPSAALLEVLDPEQNKTFVDHYLDVEYDLSKVFFIATANSLQGIPLPLQDRMEIIKLPGYLETEKRNIAKHFLIDKQTELNGLTTGTVKIPDNSIIEVIRKYTKEAGVRNLEREIATICRKVAMKNATDNKLEEKHVISSSKLESYLGVPKYKFGEKDETPQIGVCVGLAYTEFGGDILQVETALMQGSGKILITGKLGDIMKESAQAAVSYVRSKSDLFNLRSDFHKDIDIHIHVPEGAIPKDGPSAGITLATSLVSALLGIPVSNKVAMTGEITLRGRVLAIGGLREKLLAAKRSGIMDIIAPYDNKKDLKDIPAEILKDLNIIFVKHIDEVLPVALDTSLNNLFSGNSSPLSFSLQKKDLDTQITAQ